MQAIKNFTVDCITCFASSFVFFKAYFKQVTVTKLFRVSIPGKIKKLAYVPNFIEAN